MKEIDKKRLQREWPKDSRLRKIRYLGIDEVAVQKRHRYLTICVDLDTDDMVYVGEKLHTLLKLNEPLSKAHILKEELRRFWDCANKKEDRAYLRNWITMAGQSGVTLLEDFAESLQNHSRRLIAYLSPKISTARVEGINNKIKVLKRKAYGYRNMEYFKLKIYAAKKMRYPLLG